MSVNHISKDDRSSSAVNLPSDKTEGHVESEHPGELGTLRPQFASAGADGRQAVTEESEREMNEAFARKI